ncbi:MAG: hypothetical protein KKE11_06420 [Gammaproteobacteria bacterium]|nr:hypothetical protein [Gammaproteobacteria bacterium]
MRWNIFGGITDFVTGFIDKSTRERVEGTAIGAGIGGVVGLAAAVLGIAYFAPELSFGAAAVVAGGSTAVGAALGGTTGWFIVYKTQVSYRVAGLTPPPMIIRRISNEEGQAVFVLSNVKIIGVDLIREKIDQDYSPSSDLSSDDKKGHDFSKDPSYTVKIKLNNQEITFAELDYGDLQKNPDFELIITEDLPKGEAREVTEEKRKEVLESLQLMPKFLGDELYHPSDVAIEKISISSNFSDGILGKNFGEAIDRVYGWGLSVITGKPTRIKVQHENGPSHKIQTDEFLDEVADVAIKTGKYKELLGHYEEVVVDSHKRKLDIAEQNLRAENEALGHMPSLFVFSTAALLAVVLIAAGVACIFPPISSTVAAVVLIGLSFVPSGLALVSGFLSIKKSLLNRKISKIPKKREAIDKELEEKFMGLNVTRPELQSLSKHHGTELKLESKNIGNTCARIIGRWLSSPAGGFCNVLRLSNNKIDDKGAAKLAVALSGTQNIREIYLDGNYITGRGLEPFKNALEGNIAVTVFKYDDFNVSKALNQALQRELSINRYLKGQLSVDDEKRAAQYFKNKQELHNAAIEKIKNIKNLGCIQGFQVGADLQGINKEVIRKQLALMFASDNPRNSNLLSWYVTLYNGIDPEDFQKSVDQKDVLKLIKSAVFGHNLGFKFTSNPGLKALIGLQDPSRAGLLARCLEIPQDQHPQVMASVVSKFIEFEGMFDQGKENPLLKKMSKCMLGVLDNNLTFEKFVKELIAIKKQASLVEDAEKIDEMLQITMIGALESTGDDATYGKPIAALVDDDIRVNKSLSLKKMDEDIRADLIRVALDQNVSGKTENLEMSVLLSGLMGVSAAHNGKLDNDIKRVFDDYQKHQDLLGNTAHDFSGWKDCLDELEKDNKGLNDDMKAVRQLILQARLMEDYPFLKSNGSSVKDDDLKLLKKALRDKFSDLTDYRFIEEKKRLGDGVAEIVIAGCMRNKLFKSMKHNDPDEFFKILSNVNAELFKDVISGLEKIKILRFITKHDLGSSGSRVKLRFIGGGKKTSLDCGRLRRLDDVHLEELLGYSFSIKDNPIDAAEKADLVNELFKIDKLFDPELQKSDPIVHKINALIYWSISPNSLTRRDNPYYSYNEMKKELRILCNKIPDDTPIKEQLKDVLDKFTYDDLLEELLDTIDPETIPEIGADGEEEGFFDAIELPSDYNPRK